MVNLTFLIGCIGTRLLLVLLGYMYPEIIGTIVLIPAIGFLVIYFGGLRKTGIETGGAPIWWNHLRPFHALMYILFSIFSSYNGAWLFLLVDVMVGLTAHLTK